MAYFHTTVLDNQIKALPTVSTASGSIATFDTDMTENLIEVVCDIQYQQASGTPTPVNPLPITVYTSLNLSHSGADTSNPTVYNIPFGQSVAKGTLNVSTGVLTITDKVIDLGNPIYNKDTSTLSGYTLFTVQLTDRNTSILNGCSDIYDVSTQTRDYLTTHDYAITKLYAAGTAIAIRNSDYDNSTATDFKNGMLGHQLVYELATPIEIQLDSITLQTLLNENNIWCDTNGDTSVKYILSVGKAIS